MSKKVIDVKQNSKFKKQLQKAPTSVKRAFRNRFALFVIDQFHPILRNHMLTGNYQGYRSINITGDWRALYREVLFTDNRVIIEFHLFGTHSQLYK